MTTFEGQVSANDQTLERRALRIYPALVLPREFTGGDVLVFGRRQERSFVPGCFEKMSPRSGQCTEQCDEKQYAAIVSLGPGASYRCHEL